MLTKPRLRSSFVTHIGTGAESEIRRKRCSLSRSAAWTSSTLARSPSSFPVGADMSSTVPALRPRGGGFRLAHEAQEIAAPDLLDIGVAIAGLAQPRRDLGQGGNVLHVVDAAAAVPVRAQADMVDSHHLDGME